MKKYLFGLIAVAFAVAFSAFTVNGKTKITNSAVYEFVGSEEADLLTPASWQLVVTPQLECEESPVDPIVCRLSVTSSTVTFVDGEDFTDYLISKSISTKSQIENATADGITVSDFKEEIEQ